MPDATDKEPADRNESRPGHGLRILVALLVSIILPASIYAIYVLGQLEHIREHNLRGLESTAQAVSELLDNTRTTVGNLGKDPGYACTFFQRQNRARLVAPSCGELALAGNNGIDTGQLHFDVSRGTIEIVGKLKGVESLRIEVKVGTLLEQVPFGSVFDRLMIVDNDGKLLGSAITPQRSSPMLPPGVAATGGSSPPVRVLDLKELKFVGSTKDAPINFDAFGESTLVHPVILGGTRYTLMCQPWRIANVGERSSAPTWRLCGFIDGQRAFQQALDVAPQFIILLLVLFTLAVISWPVLKVLSLAPRERIRFADMFLMLLATLALVMVLSIGVADLGTYAQLRENSQTRLELLAAEIETHVRAEFAQMREELTRYDRAIADRASTDAKALRLDEATRVGCLLLKSRTTDASANDGACQPNETPLAELLTPPTQYLDFENVFWMRPCDGQQFIKGTVRTQSTPAVPTSGREYFEAVKHNRLWSVRPASAGGLERGEPDRFFVDTSASITTGEFFAALSIESGIKSDAAGSWRSADCTADEATRFAAAMTGRPVSLSYPILAPGIGFAVINQAGRVLFHSDERRAVFENLLDDEGLGDRLRAALGARADARFHAHYQTRPHQVYVHSLDDIPWAIVTFSDDEILRTQHVELLAQTAILITLYLLLAVLGTLVYILVHGRQPPLWVWPRREEKYRVLYASTVWTLCAQVILFLLTLDVLRGEVLAFACLVLPLSGVLTIVIAARQAQLLNARPLHGMTVEDHRAAVAGRFRRCIALLLLLAIVLLLGSTVVMKRYYPVAATQSDPGIETAGLAILLVIVIAAGAIGERFRGRQRLREAGQVFPWVRWWREPLRPHIVATIIVWLVLGALPAYGLYKFALANEMTVASMNEQAYLGRAFAWRACKMQDESRKLPARSSGAPQQRQPTGTQRSGDSNPAYSGIYLSASLSRDVQVTTEQPDYTPVGERAVGHPFWQYIANLAPVYNETTTYSRYFEPTAPAENSTFTWIKATDGRAGPMLLYKHGSAGTCGGSMPYVASRLPLLEPQFNSVGVLVALGFMAVLFAWTTFAVRKLFFGDIEVEARRMPHAEEGLPLVVQPERLDLPPDLAWAKSEVAPIFDPYLHISDEMLKELCEKGTTRRAVVDRILEQERAFYGSVWQKCNDEEKLLLIQLVEEGFANPRQNEIVRRLMKRGLIRRDPVVRPMNESFALFVSSQAEPEDIRDQETVHRGMRWSLVRNVLIGALVLILIFLSVTQRDVVEVWIAYLGTAAAGAGGVLKLFSMLGRSGTQKSN